MRFVMFATVLCLLLPACGGGGKNHPEIISTFPAHLQVLNAPLAALRVTYDEEVAILNPNDASVVLEGEINIPVRMRQRIGEPCCLYIEPLDGTFFPDGRFVVVRIEQGAVINVDRHYAKDEFIYAFTVGPAQSIYVGRGSIVTPLHPETLQPSADVPTPGGRTAVGIQVTSPNDTPRVFVQLNSGGGARQPIARFAPGDGAMVPITLTTSTGAADLTATARTLGSGPDGRFLYAAFRDESTQRVRLSRIDVTTGTESAALELSIPAGVNTQPLGLTIERDRRLVLIVCADGATGRQAYVQIDTFTEMDRDPVSPGVQAYVLPEGAGPMLWLDDQAIIAPPTTSTVTFTRTSSNGFSTNAPVATGANVDVVRTHDFQVFMTPLMAYTDGQGIVARTNAAQFQDPGLLTISDDVGAGTTNATAVTAMAPYVSDNRFLVALNTDVLTRWLWDGNGVDQEDLNVTIDGIQGLDVSATLPGITTISRAQGTFPSAP